MVVKMNYDYDENFECNILVVCRTGCGKSICTEFRKKQMFGNIKEMTWASKILLPKEREDQIRTCFVDEKIDFKHVESTNEVDYFLEYIQRTKPLGNKNNLGENIELSCLIVLDIVFGLSDTSDTFANILAVSRKFGLTCVYAFHTLYPTRQNWKIILSETKDWAYKRIINRITRSWSILKTYFISTKY